MKNKAPFIVVAAVLALVLIGGGIYYATAGDSGKMTHDNSDGHHDDDKAKSTSPSAAASAGAVEQNTVTIENFGYAPEVIKVKAGTKVTWTNKDTVPHNVVGDEYDELNGKLLDKGESFSFTFDEPGTYPYHCAPHPYMKGTVIVE